MLSPGAGPTILTNDIIPAGAHLTESEKDCSIGVRVRLLEYFYVFHGVSKSRFGRMRAFDTNTSLFCLTTMIA